MNLPVILLVLAALADIVSSKRVFDRGGVEANPLVSKLFGKRPPFAAMVAVKAAAGGLAIWYGDPIWCYVGAAVWAAAAIYNTKLGMRLKNDR